MVVAYLFVHQSKKRSYPLRVTQRLRNLLFVRSYNHVHKVYEGCFLQHEIDIDALWAVVQFENTHQELLVSTAVIVDESGDSSDLQRT